MRGVGAQVEPIDPVQQAAAKAACNAQEIDTLSPRWDVRREAASGHGLSMMMTRAVLCAQAAVVEAGLDAVVHCVKQREKRMACRAAQLSIKVSIRYMYTDHTQVYIPKAAQYMYM